jgi:hypothetical protein
MAFEYNQGNPLAIKPTATPRVKDQDKAPAPVFTGPSKYSPQVPAAPKPPAAPSAPAAPVVTTTPKATPEDIMWRIPSLGTAPSPSAPTESKTADEAPSPTVFQQAGDKQGLSKADQDAFFILKEVFAQYGLEDLFPVIEGYMKANVGPAEARLKLKNEQAYKDRFKGNELRRSKGLNVLSEAEYLDLENSYSQTLKAYGLQNYYGSAVTSQDRKNRNLKLADIIGNDISAVEFKDRVSIAVDRVTNADTYTKTAFKQFYNINDSDLVGYFLDPEKALPSLKEKAVAAEIGGAALGQNLAATSATAEELARFGVTREQAIQGYANIADILPTAQKLSSIYAQEGITYGQTQAEQEAFKGLASEQRKRKQLMARETATFGGSSGISKSSLSNGSAGAL